MKPATRTSDKELRKAKEGDVIVVPMGMIFPHAILLDLVEEDEHGQVIGWGKAIKREGCSDWHVGETFSVCLGYTDNFNGFIGWADRA